VESGHKSLPNCKCAVRRCFSTLTSTYDQKMGGFGEAPKFPQPGWLLHCMLLGSLTVCVLNVKFKQVIEQASDRSAVCACSKF